MSFEIEERVRIITRTCNHKISCAYFPGLEGCVGHEGSIKETYRLDKVGVDFGNCWCSFNKEDVQRISTKELL
jgi:hypothetical protein